MDRKKGVRWDAPCFHQTDDHPVVLVAWIDAIYYCNWLSILEGLRPFYNIQVISRKYPNWDANGYRLPTEAEWELSCRAGSMTSFNIGQNITADQSNYNGNCPYKKFPKGIFRKTTTPIESFVPNAHGLYDMHGNVNEWCWVYIMIMRIEKENK